MLCGHTDSKQYHKGVLDKALELSFVGVMSILKVFIFINEKCVDSRQEFPVSLMSTIVGGDTRTFVCQTS